MCHISKVELKLYKHYSKAGLGDIVSAAVEPKLTLVIMFHTFVTRNRVSNGTHVVVA